MTLKTGVVGVGHLGQHHARVYSELDGVELVGVYDADIDRAREIASRHDVRAFSDADALLDEIDAASIVVPTPAHFAVARPFLEAGKDLLIEKPLAANLDEADELNAMAERSGSILQVGHIERFNPCVVAALPFVGDPLFIECDRIHPFSLRSTEVSVVLDLMIHDLDLVLHLTPGEVSELDALGACVLSPTEDLATARILFENGCTALLKTSRVALNRSRKIRIFSEHSYVSLDLVEKKGMRIYLREGYDPKVLLDEAGRLSAPEGEAAFLAENVRTEFLEIPDHEPLALELRSFVDAVRQRTTPPVTGVQGRRAMAAAERVENCIAAHRSRIREKRS